MMLPRNDEEQVALIEKMLARAARLNWLLKLAVLMAAALFVGAALARWLR